MHIDEQILNVIDELALIIDVVSQKIIFANEHVYTAFPDSEELEQLRYQLIRECKQSDAVVSINGLLFGFKLSKHYFIELAEEVINTKTIEDKFAIVYFNIDKFQTFNDAYGFSVGDEFLKSVVKTIMDEIEYYIEARYSDDHFVVLTSIEGLIDKIKRIHEKVHTYQRDVIMEIKAGIYELHDDTPISKACDLAKLACDSIKYNYHEDYRFYDASLRDQLLKEKYIIDNIDKAVENRYLKVYYQPVVRVISDVICGMESLVRWDDPVKGFLSPGDFIPILEKHRLIDRVDKYVIEKQRNELSRALDAARLANDAKTEFFSRMSHDMRTPMNGILGLSMLSENENDIDVLKSNMLKIRESGEYLLGLINDTLDFQRIESGRMNIRKQNVDNKEFWNNIIDMVKQSASKKNIEFRVKNDGYNLDGYVKVDPLRVKQIFINLLSNAIKYTLPGGTVELEIKTLSKHDNISHVRFIIRDTGVGMSREYLDNGLFKPFSQEKNDMTLQYAGSGLGLSIVKNLLDLMSGSIEVSSELGVGTTFTIEMDIESVDNVDIKKINKEDIRKKEKIKEILDGRHILLVEDHPLNAEIASMLLANMNCIVTRADNGKRAIDIYKASKIKEFDLILMDIRMPVMDGIESTKGIRALDRPDAKDIPIIAMTANAYEDDVRKSIEAGMNAHLAKPIEPDRMFDTMARYISMSSNFFKENV